MKPSTLAAAVALILASSPAFASAVYVLDTSSDPSLGAGPYEKLTVTLTDPTHATLEAIGLGVYSFGDFAVNVNASSFTGSLLSFTARAGDAQTPTYSVGSGNIGANLGNFSLIQNDSPNGFSSSVTSLTFTLTDNSGTWANSADVLVGNNNVPPEFAAAHTFNATGGSFFSSDSNTPTCTDCGAPAGPTPTPEPISLAVIASALIGLGLVRRRGAN